VRFAQGFFVMAAFVAMYNYLIFLLLGPPYRLPVETASAVYLLYLVGSFGAAALGRLADRLGRSTVVSLSLGLAVAGALTTLAVSLPVKLVGLAAFTAAFFGAHVSASTAVAEGAVGRRAAASSLYLSAYYLGSSLGGTSIGLLWEAYRWPGVVAGLLLALLPALGLGLRRDTAGGRAVSPPF
jgi:YNFM family putative membrane transporter